MNDFGFPNLSDQLFRNITSLLFEETGVSLKDHKKYLVIHRLSKFVGENKPFRTFEDYYQALSHDNNGNLMVDLVNSLTTNYSYFFRDDIHFKFLKQYLQEKYQQEPYIRLWSAACSSGEEAYSMAISCIQALPVVQSIDLKILATDISTNVLNTADRGIYHYTKVRNHIEEMELRKYFTFDFKKKCFTIKPFVKDLISFRYLNLFETYPFKKMFDVVFLRNVLIYFDNKEKELAVNKIYDYIKPNGYLIIGLSETLVGIKYPFKALKNSIYQKV
jgi:chemotaxis protein methyltransferase CheR